jgi:hypothetical protein
MGQGVGRRRSGVPRQASRRAAMSAISIDRGSDGAGIARVGADWLGIAAAPAFAMMALMTVCLGGGMEPLCSATPVGSLMSGMAPMYLLMSAFHAGPWLRLMAGRRN